MKPTFKGTFCKVNPYTLHRTISAFLQSMNNLVDHNAKLASKPTNNKKTYAILHFITLLNPLAEQNHLDVNISHHMKLQNKANIIIRKKQAKQELV